MSPILYLINGEDEFLKKKEISQIEKGLFSSPLQKDFNYAVFDAKETGIEEVIKTAKILPWQVSYRLTVVHNIEFLKSPQQNILISYLLHPAPRTIFILTSVKIDKREKLYQVVPKTGKVINVGFSPSHIEQWIKQKIGESGKAISFADTSFLKQKAGVNSQNLAQNIDKLISYVGGRTEIKKEDIEDVVSRDNLNTIFDLTAAISKKDKTDALNVLNNLFSQGKKAGEIVAMLFWQVNRLWRGKQILEQGQREKLGKELNIPPFFLKGFIDSLKNFSLTELKRNIELLAKTDLQIKTTATKTELILEILVIKLCL
ncbi:MAG: DNA polymerase III subunit delta [Candidatus Omnitrophica bacterium]|nr:DNA polymerase III subunit delta [Candidatus Omnitrophota bacterium]